MFRSYLAAALNNLARNRLYAAISILGLAVGMAAAILTGLYIRDELTFDRFFPDSRNVYVAVSTVQAPGRGPVVVDRAPWQVAEWLKDFPGVEGTVRVTKDDEAVRHGEVQALEHVAWVDPDMFSVLALPALAGDPAATMRQPDGVVITRSMARKYFGQDAPLGQVLDVNSGIPLRVGAVLKDIPSNTRVTEQIYLPGLKAGSPTRRADAQPVRRGAFVPGNRAYFRFADAGAAARANAEMPAFIARHMALADGKMLGGVRASIRLVSLADLHLYPLGGSSLVEAGAQGSRSALTALGLIAVLILVVAAINFVNLMTARAACRAVEVGVRKVSGAQRSDLILQFVGEAVFYALVGLVLAIAVVELAAPAARNLLDRPLEFAYWRDPVLLTALLAMTLLVGAGGGFYPALIQSGFPPAAVLKGGLPHAAGSEAIRSVLAALQFAALIGLALGVIVIGLQTHYALNEGLGVDTDRILLMETVPTPDFAAPPGPPRPLCRDAFPDQVRALPGVKGAACSAGDALALWDGEYTIDLPSGAQRIGAAGIDYGFLELYGLKPIAGRFFSRQHPGDESVLVQPPRPSVVVINARAARLLGYPNAAVAVGQPVEIEFGSKRAAVQIIGVAPDFSFDLMHGPQRPMVFYEASPALGWISIKLAGGRISTTVKAIDALWRRTGSTRPPSHRFIDDHLRTIYVDAIREGYLIDVLCGVAVVIAALGLFGLAAFTAERRTKEIGVRKAMGASSTDIVRLLLWQFTKPVLWANLVAWPLAGWALDRWLHGFSRHIDLQPWIFIAASAAALAIAWITVLAHTVRVAGAKPIGALRYE